MAIELKLRRGNSTENDSFTGSLGEVTVDTTNNTLRVHDGSTLGGTESVSLTGSQVLENKTISSPEFTGQITGDLIPSVDVTYDLGSTSNRWKDLFLSGNTIDIGGATISVTNGSFEFKDSSGNDAEVSLAANTTNDLSEGSSNLYYTDSRVRNAVSVSGDLSYDSATGTFSFTERTDSEVRGLVSATGDLSYDSATGVFSVTTYKSSDFDIDFSGKDTDDLTEGVSNLYYTDARVDSHLSGGTGVSYSSGTISIGQSVGTTDNVTFNDVTISGDLTVTGTTTTLNTSTLDVEDINITVANGATNAAAANGAGLTADLGSDGSATFTYDSANDRWAMNKSLDTDLIGNVTGTVSDISNHDTDDLSEGTTNLYYTDTRTRNALSASGDLSYSSSTGEFSVTTYKSSDFDSDFSGKSTSDLSEGTSSLYFTETRARDALSASGDLSYDSSTGTFSFTERTDAEVRGLLSVVGDLSYDSATGTFSVTTYKSSDFDSDFSGKSTDDLSEGSTNLYAAQPVGTTDNVSFNDVTVNGVLSTDDITATTVTASNDVVIQGNLTVQGTTTSTNTNEITTESATVTLVDGLDENTSPSQDAGLVINRGNSPNKTFLWREDVDKWSLNTESLIAGNVEANLVGDVTGTVSDISNHNTDDLSEGSGNLYYTDARVDAHLSGGTGVSYSSGTISIGQAVGTTDNVTFNDLTVSGDLTVTGTTTSLNTTTLDVEDINITVANGATDASAANGAGLTADLGTDGTATFTYDSANDRWSMNKSLDTNLVGDVTGTVSDISNHDTDDLSEGTSNLYFTESRARSSISGSTGISYNSSTGSISIDNTVATLSDTQTLTNKTLDLTDNTLTTTLSQLNSGLSDATLITEAPNDGNAYVRQNGQWVDINNIVYSSSTVT